MSSNSTFQIHAIVHTHCPTLSNLVRQTRCWLRTHYPGPILVLCPDHACACLSERYRVGARFIPSIYPGPILSVDNNFGARSIALNLSFLFQVLPHSFREKLQDYIQNIKQLASYSAINTILHQAVKGECACTGMALPQSLQY